MITITSTFTAEPLRNRLEGLLRKFTEEKVCFFYNQIFQQLLMPTSKLNANDKGLNVILIRLCDLFDSKQSLQEISEKISVLTIAFQTAQEKMKVPLLVILTPNENKVSIQNFFFDEIEDKLRNNLVFYKNILFIKSKETLENFKSNIIFDNFSEKYGHIPYSLDYFNSLATTIARKYSLLSRKPYKVIILDCDGTLWDGIIEEDGIEGIKIDEEYIAFHKFIIQCLKNGFLIALCTKNSRESIFDVFKNHKNMILNIEKHICTYRINWEKKSSNIRSIAKELDLGLDSFIFIDDNNIECAEVRADIPEILTIELPKTKSDRLPYLKNIWAFDYLSKASEDENRTKYYQDNKLREQIKKKSTSYSNFLKDLKIKTTICYAKIKDYERIYQLSQRTNQFNIYPNSMTAIEFENSIKIKDRHCLIINVKDKFGDYGLVGVVVYELQQKNLIIKAFFLSCRILGRNIEQEIVNYLANIAKNNHIECIRFPFIITQKNIPAINFLKKISRKKDLKNENEVFIKSHEINQINFEPNKYEYSENIESIKKNKNHISNDYMLEIALQNLNNKNLKNNGNINIEKIKIIRFNLINIFARYNININKYDIPFSYLGLDSLRSVLIASEIHKNYQISINPFNLLEDQITFDKLFDNVLKKIKNVKMLKNKSFDPYYIPLSYPQKRLWYDEKISGFTNKNNMFIAYEILSDIHKDLLVDSLNDLINRHDILRFSFFEKNDEPFIKLNPISDIKLKFEYLKNPSLSKQYQLIDDFKYKVFDLSQAPLMRVGLITKKENSSILLVAIHHIIHDGWSLSILLHELSILYEARLKNIKVLPLEKAASFIEFTSWQNKNISSQMLLKQNKFWEKYLQKISKLELIYDNPRQEFDDKIMSKRINFKLDIITTKKLKALAKNNHVTLYEVLISAFSILLAHYSNQTDVNFVTAFSGRHNILAAKTIGFFVNLVLLRFNINSKDYFYTILKHNKKIILEVFNNQDLPFNEILQITGENISSKIHNFSQAGFFFQNYPIPEFVINGKKCKRILSDDEANILYDSCQECRFGNIVCFMQESEYNLHGLFEYNIELFDEKTIHHMILSFKTLLKNITKNPNIPALNIEIVSNKQKKILLSKWSKPSKSIAYTKNLILYFLEQVTKNPNNIAIQYQNTTISYIELDKWSNQLAHTLKKYGIKVETPIGIFLDKKIEYIVAILAIIKSGGCYVPIEKEQPIARIIYIIKDVSLAHFISDTDGIQYIKNNIKLSLFILNVDKKNIDKSYEKPIIIHRKKNQLAYIMYTSGSTGNPKGVMIEQSGIMRLVKSTNYIKITSKDRIAQTSSITFDAATFEIWGALLNGARLVIVDKKILLESNYFQRFLSDKKISILFLTTQLFHFYAYSHSKLFKNIKYLIVGGEAIISDSVKNIFTQIQHPKYLINGYGPTENTTFSITYSIKNHDDIKNPLPIGKPINNTYAYILGRNLNVIPIGVPGKLYLSGQGVSRGYLNNKNLNNKKFIYHFNKKLYDTGDIVSWQSDGNIRYIGREDNQIKINGYRIELDEIQAHLENHCLVEQAVVLVKKIEHQQLQAYIQLKNNKNLSEIDLYHYLKLTLPKYMVPTLFYQVDNFPMNINGKIDKKNLIKKYVKPVSYNEYEIPSGSLQNKITKIYAQVLKIEEKNIGINTDFFDLGGNSILALTLIHIIHDIFDIKINFSDLYENCTIKSLSEKINHMLNDSAFILTKKIYYKQSLKKIKAGDPKNVPIVFIHPIGGTGFCYLDLIKLLPKDQPCYIVQDPSIDANQILFDDIFSMAQYYNNMLLEYFKSKEFILAGFSFGGMLSMEMVYQLEQRKLDNIVKYIVIFDTWIVSNFMDIEAKKSLKKSIMQQYKIIANNLSQENIDPKPWMELYYFRLQELGFSYIPSKINKKIILFKASQQSEEFSAMKDSTNYLKYFTENTIDVYMIPGNHNSILQPPNVKNISYIITEKINKY